MDSVAIRRSFIDFFVERGHRQVPSSSLVPDALDASVLLTTAGMQPFKPYFLGLRPPPGQRLTSVQKCFRTVDIDEVGKTARHLTFFEMMGNFSFGDYFKQGAVEMAWELSTQGWSLDRSHIWATIYEGDENVPLDAEARDLWLAVGLPAERIVPLGEDNFWKAGPTGPCGPCSELYLDRGPEHGCGRADCLPGCDCDRFMEFWNLVFMQYDRDEAGRLTPLPRQNIDTGCGIERAAALLQRKHSIYETDAFRSIIAPLEEWAGVRYVDGGDAQKALTVLSDHGRAMTMLATDGVIPSNEGRGYVLRRIIRRAVQHGARIGLPTPLLGRLQAMVVDSLGEFHPDLDQNSSEVRRLLEAEEERFARTLATGSKLLGEIIERARGEGRTAIAADDAFRLHDTYGFPVEVTAEIAREAGLSVDEAGFAERMDEQRHRARAAARSGDGADAERVAAFVTHAGYATVFVGYDTLDVVTTADAVEPLGDGRLLVKLRESPFYPEGGGQVADAGTIEADDGRAAIEAVHRFDGDQALTVRLEHGSLRAGETVRAVVDRARRSPIVANHTGTHLLHRALRNVLGDHVQQAGSAVRPDSLRFDFSHDRPMTPAELEAVEDEVNAIVIANRPVRIFETTQDEARRLGATMLFGEKYGARVRLVEIEDYSRELCGGTHARSTSEVGPFRILRESSVGQGVRRIEAVTSGAALRLLRQHDQLAERAARAARTTPDQLPAAIEGLTSRVRELEKASRSDGASDIGGLAATAVTHDGLKLLAVEAPPGTVGDALLQLSDRLKGALGPSAVVVGARDGEGSVQLVANLTQEAVAAGLSAVDIIRAVAPIVGGGGGGRPMMARAGGRDPARLADALDEARRTLLASLA